MILVTLPLDVDLKWPDIEDRTWAWVTDPHRPITVDDLDQHPDLKVIVTASTGVNHLPLKEADQRGIDVLSLLDDREGLNTIRASSEGAFMLLLMALRNAKTALGDVENWQANEDEWRGNELMGKDVGIIGLGRIGSNLYRWLYSFDARVKYIYDPPKVSGTDLFELFRGSQIIIISCTLNNETRGMVTKELIKSMPVNGVLVNIARGEVLSENAHEAFVDRPDLRYGADVLAGEVTGEHLKSPLLSMPNVTVLPHTAGITIESQTKAAKIARDLLANWAARVYTKVE